MIIRCCDVETTGLEPLDDIIEIGWCDLLVVEGCEPTVGSPQSTLVNPFRRIPAESSAVHHITDDDVKDAPPIAVAMDKLLEGSPTILAAHVARFEQQFIATSLPWICSYKTALKVAPNAPAHNLQTLRYWSSLAVDRELAAPSHRAGPDAYVCAALLARMLKKMPAAEMVELSTRPALLVRVGFGKHFGLPWAEIPRDYLDWIVNKSGMDDADVLFTARHHLRSA